MHLLYIGCVLIVVLLAGWLGSLATRRVERINRERDTE